jgi:hypothetical protein
LTPINAKANPARKSRFSIIAPALAGLILENTYNVSHSSALRYHGVSLDGFQKRRVQRVRAHFESQFRNAPDVSDGTLVQNGE